MSKSVIVESEVKWLHLLNDNVGPRTKWKGNEKEAARAFTRQFCLTV